MSGLPLAGVALEIARVGTRGILKDTPASPSIHHVSNARDWLLRRSPTGGTQRRAAIQPLAHGWCAKMPRRASRRTLRTSREDGEAWEVRRPGFGSAAIGSKARVRGSAAKSGLSDGSAVKREEDVRSSWAKGAKGTARPAFRAAALRRHASEGSRGAGRAGALPGDRAEAEPSRSAPANGASCLTPALCMR